MDTTRTTSRDLHTYRRLTRLRNQRHLVVAATVMLAALAVTGQTAVTIAGNLPFEPVSGLSILTAVFSLVTPLAVSTAAIATGSATDNPTVRIGLLFIAAFSIVGSISSAAVLPAVLGVTMGGGVSLYGGLTHTDEPVSVRRLLLVGSVLVGTAVSLGGTIGITPGGSHTVGVGATVTAIALLAVELPVDHRSLVGGSIVAAGVVWVSIAAPFAAGATLLVGFGITHLSVVIVALAIGGAVAALLSGIQTRAVIPVAGTGLCLFAGIPATPTTAAALLVGVTVVIHRTALRPQEGSA